MEELYLIAENQYVLKSFQKTIEFKNNGYIVKLPIKKLINCFLINTQPQRNVWIIYESN